MGLTSTTFQVVTIVWAVAGAVAVFVLWNRIPGRRPLVAVLGRVGVVVGSQALTALALLVSLNIALGGMIVSWTDLLGMDSVSGGTYSGQPGQWRDQQAAARRAAAASLRAPTEHRHFDDVGEGFGKTVITGAKSGVTGRVYVSTPPGYADHPNQYYPVLELLPGVPGSPEGWVRPMSVAKHLQAAIKAGKSHPYVLVVPDISPVPGHNSPAVNEECSDVPGDANIDTWLTQDVPALVLANFRVIGAASGWGVMGYSTGGFCAAKLVLEHPDRFATAVSLSGYYTPESTLLTQDPELARANSPLWKVKHDRTPTVSLLMTASAQDKIDPAAEARNMVAAAAANPASRATEISAFIVPYGGGHNQAAWQKLLPTAFGWLTQRTVGPMAG